ncbi:MAG: hypothetical protein Q7R73_02925 [bacterium]|nr:hypothetical protein [bacterium]
MPDTQRHKDPRTLGEPFRSFREAELAIEKSRAVFCFYQHRVLGRSLRTIAKEQGMSYERIRHLSGRAEAAYGITAENYGAHADTDRR